MDVRDSEAINMNESMMSIASDTLRDIRFSSSNRFSTQITAATVPDITATSVDSNREQGTNQKKEFEEDVKESARNVSASTRGSDVRQLAHNKWDVVRTRLVPKEEPEEDEMPIMQMYI